MDRRALRAAVKRAQKEPVSKAKLITIEPGAVRVMTAGELPRPPGGADAMTREFLFLGIKFADHLLRHSPWSFVRGVRYALVKAARR